MSEEQNVIFNKGIYYYDVECSAAAASDAKANGGSNSDVDKFLKALSYQESGGDPKQAGSAGGARGKYQYIDSTWQSRKSIYGPSGKYSKANDAPEEVQDAVAYIEYAVKFKQLDNDLFKLAVSHFYPAANEDKSKLDVVPPSNNITPRQYAEKLITSIKNGGAWEKIPLKYDKAPEFDKWLAKAGVDAGSPGGSSGASGGAVYVLGDSISVRAKDELKSSIEAKDLKPYINASEGRSITGKGTTDGFKTSGLDAVDDDKTRVKNASTIVIELGTNPNSNFDDSVKDLIKKVRSYNKDAQIYWVNVFSNTRKADDTNKTLDDLAESQKYEVIDAASSKIELSSDKIHQTDPEGSKQFARTVANSLDSQKDDENTDKKASNTCECDTGGKQDNNFSGSGNIEKAYNFFINDMKYSKEQAAGAVGSLMFESAGLNTKILNKGGSGAYGIAQWLDARKTKLLAKKDPDTIETQLSYIKEELDGGWKDASNKVKAAKSYQDAQKAWTLYYEGLSQNPEQWFFTERNANAKKVLAKYGSGSTDQSTPSADATGCSKKEGGQVDGEWALPVDKKWFKSNPDWFSKPHHDHPGADIPVPRGTPVYSISKGTVAPAPNGFGEGVQVNYENGIQFIYGHGIDGGTLKGAKPGDKVEPGQLLMHSNNTGSSEGDHLHFGIFLNGSNAYCPQKLLMAIGKGTPVPDIKSLSKTDCIGGSL